MKLIIDKGVEKILDEILKISKVLAVTISSYEGLVIFEKGVEAIDKRKLSVEIAKIAKSVKKHLPSQIKEGISLYVYYEKYELIMVFLENSIFSSLCEKNVNMGFLKIKMKKVIPQIKISF